MRKIITRWGFFRSKQRGWMSWLQVSSLLLLLCSAGGVKANVSGEVYREWSFNGTTSNVYGTRDLNELGVEGISVRVTGDNGVTETVTSSTTGAWSSTVGSLGNHVRVEFLNIPSYLFPSMTDSGTNTLVQFVTDGDTSVNLGLYNPADYFDTSTPNLVTSVYVNGDPLATTGNGDPLAKDFSSLRMFPDNSENWIWDAPTYTNLANLGDIGSTWGLAYQRETGTLFAAAFVKRHVGLGSIDGSNTTTGGIYAIDVATQTVTPWLDINTLSGVNAGQDPRTEEGSTLPPERTSPNHDVLAFDAVGKRGIGDIDMSEDGKMLYVMELAGRQLLMIDVASKTLSAAIVVPNPDAARCNADDVRPFAIGVNDAEVYIGVVCSAETSRDTDDLHAYVMQLNGSTFTTVLDYSLVFPRGKRQGVDNVAPADWRPWARDWNDVLDKDTWYASALSPIFSDIEFDIDGSLIMGFMDRSAHQLGFKNYSTDTVSTSTSTEGLSQGDIYRACPNGTGSWLLESNGSCGGAITTGVDNAEGPGGGEFYVGDFGRSQNEHQNSHLGGLAFLPGSGRVVLSQMDPADGSMAVAGIKWLSNSSGKGEQAFILTRESGKAGGEGTFGKAGGLGEVEILGSAAPVEVGDRIWFDANSNGLQDANEVGIDGVNVTLTCGQDTASVTTSRGGLYAFSNASGGNASFMDWGESCVLRVDSSQDALSAYLLSNSNANGETGNNAATDLLDSDAIDNAGTAEINFTVGASGENNHTLDFGFVERPQADLQLSKTVNPTIIQRGETAIFNLTVSNAGAATATGVVVKDVLPAALLYVSDDGAGAYVNASGHWTIGNIPAGESRSLNITVRSPDVPF